LEWKSFLLAVESLGLGRESVSQPAEQMFLRERPGYRLGSLFRRFPVLSRLWILAIRQWHDHIGEVLARVRKDRDGISGLFFDKRPIGRIRDLRPGLSDPHDGGRSVTLLEFDSGRLIYKPRSGRSEAAWFALLAWMNRQGFTPKLRVARVLEYRSYSWMEYVEATSCRDDAAVRRFYERLGGMIAAAYHLKAVDCHRDNVIAAGEHPVLVDIDAVWHVSPLTRTQTPVDVLYRTGFFPNSRRRSLQSRSSVLGPTAAGNHVARINGRPALAANYVTAIIRGFSRGWRCLVGTANRRAALRQRVRQIRAGRRRWIYLATEKYAAIRRASLSPTALRSEKARDAVLEHLCSRDSASRGVIRAEIKALRQLDLPYFLRQTAESTPPENESVPAEMIAAIQTALSPNRGGHSR
jgi:lantibiotic modifying enzyme